MPTDPVLAILALLLLWLTVRLFVYRDRDGEGEPGRTSVKVRGRKGVKVITSLPPRPVAFASTVSVSDGPESEVSYSVNLGALTCNCPDFESRRAELQPDAIGRVCRHMSDALQSSGASSSMDELLRAIVEFGPTKRTYYQIPPDHRTVAIGHTPGSGDLDVFARVDVRGKKGEPTPGPYQHFSYSLRSRSWPPDRRPPDDKQIQQVISDLPLST